MFSFLLAEKHGTCSYPVIQDEYSYFSTALHLYSNYNVTVSNAAIQIHGRHSWASWHFTSDLTDTCAFCSHLVFGTFDDSVADFASCVRLCWQARSA